MSEFSQRELQPEELVWREMQPFLEARGYMLPFRLRPGWKPSWKESELPNIFVHDDANGGFAAKGDIAMSATVIPGRTSVVLKKVSTGTSELPLMSKLSSEPYSKHPYNRSIPLLDVVLMPDSDELVYLVLPLLAPFHRPPFETPAEILHCFRRYLQGLSFLHGENIAHRDIDIENSMMQPGTMFPKGFHPIRHSRTFVGDPITGPPRLRRAPRISRSLSDVKYYIIDYGHANQYPREPYALQPMVYGEHGHFKHAPPEMKPDRYFNPLPVDVYKLGGMFLDVLDKYEGWDDKAVRGWLNMLMEANPSYRPTAEQALRECEDIIKSYKPTDLHKKIYSKERGQRGRRRSLVEIFYTLKAVYNGTDNMKRELFENIEPNDKTNATTKHDNIPSRLLSTLRYVAS